METAVLVYRDHPRVSTTHYDDHVNYILSRSRSLANILCEATDNETHQKHLLQYVWPYIGSFHENLSVERDKQITLLKYNLLPSPLFTDWFMFCSCTNGRNEEKWVRKLVKRDLLMSPAKKTNSSEFFTKIRKFSQSFTEINSVQLCENSPCNSV